MKYVVFKDKLFIPHMQIDGTETWVPLENIKIEVDNDDPTRIVILSRSAILKLITELKEITADVKWFVTLEGVTELPTADAIKTLYNSTDPEVALFVNDIKDGAVVALSATPKTVELDGIQYQTVQVALNDGILYDLPENGLFETAIFTANGWQIDNTKNTIPKQITTIQGDILNVKGNIGTLEQSIANINARLSDQGIFLTQANLKDIQGKGQIALTGTPSEPNKIPTRAEVGSMGASLLTQIGEAKSDAATAKTNAATAQTSANTATTQAGEALAKATTATNDLVPVKQEAHDAKVDAAKANAGLAQEIIDRKAEDAALDAKIAANTGAIATNTQTIAANKVILDGVKAQADLDHADLATNIKPGLTAATHAANEALSYGQDWNTTKGDVAMKSELEVKARIDMKGRPITKVGANSYKIDFGAWNGNPALDLSGISNGIKAIINIHRTTNTDPVQNRYNDLIDQHYNDATSDGTCTIYLADSLSTLEKTQYTATVIVSNTQATFSLTKADGTAANLNAGQEAVILAYQAVSITFEGTNPQTINAGDEVARAQIAELTRKVTRNSNELSIKQGVLGIAQLEVLAGIPFTTALKAVYDAAVAAKVKVNATDAEKALSAITATEVLAGVAYVDAKVAAAGVPATVTQDITQLKGVKVQKNGADLAAAQVALSALTAADLLVDKTYVDAIVALKQNSTLAAAIAGATTVEGALAAINTIASQAKAAAEAVDISSKQNINDNSLTTAAKNIPGAIIELKALADTHTAKLAEHETKLNLDDTHLVDLETLLGL